MMRLYRFFPASLIGLSLALLALGGCGDDPVENPEFSELEVICGDAESNELSSVVQRVQVHVTDPNRDLLEVKGEINGVMMTLEDPDADLYFTWDAPEGADPMACKGDFVVSLKAIDADGSSTNFYEVVSK